MRQHAARPRQNRRRAGFSVRPVFWYLLGLAAVLWAASRTETGAKVVQKVTEAAAGLLPRGIRNNNPGNIERTGDKWRGMAPEQTDPRFVVFADPVFGLRAMARVLRNYQRAGFTTVRQMIHRWAPPAENATDAYVDAVAAAIGKRPDDDVTDADFPALMAAIVKHENGMQPYPPELFAQALQLERTA